MTGLTGLEVALAVPSAAVIGLAVGVLLGRRAREAVDRPGQDAAVLAQTRTLLRHQSDLYIAAVQRLYDLDHYGTTYLCLCGQDCDDPTCPCECHL